MRSFYMVEGNDCQRIVEGENRGCVIDLDFLGIVSTIPEASFSFLVETLESIALMFSDRVILCFLIQPLTNLLNFII